MIRKLVLATVKYGCTNSLKQYFHCCFTFYKSQIMNFLETDSDAQRLVLSFLPLEERLAPSVGSGACW